MHGYLTNMLETSKSVYEHVVYDSEGVEKGKVVYCISDHNKLENLDKAQKMDDDLWPRNQLVAFALIESRT